MPRVVDDQRSVVPVADKLHAARGFDPPDVGELGQINLTRVQIRRKNLVC